LGVGEHCLEIVVFHFGDKAGMGQMGGPAFLLVQSEVVSTGNDWECREDKSRTPIGPEWGGKGRYYVVGAGERIEATLRGGDSRS
jgi:hypothetical protein